MAKVEVEIFDFFDPIEFLKSEFKARKENRSAYSYEQFAEDCGFAKNNFLYNLIKGTRNLTLNAAKKIASHLPLRKHRRNYFLALVKVYSAKTIEQRETFFNEALQHRIDSLDPSKERALLRYLSAWYHSVVRELVCHNEFQADPKWISNKLNPSITEEEALQSWELLQDIGFVVFNQETKKWEQKEAFIVPNNGLHNLVMVRYHHQMLEIARHNTFTVDAINRRYEAMTFSVKQEDMNQINQRVTKFFDELIEEYKIVQDPETVLHLNLNFYPVSVQTETQSQTQKARELKNSKGSSKGS